jgi:hypothetical protein
MCLAGVFHFRPCRRRPANERNQKPMSTTAQMIANQANAQHSTGPRTEAGKTTSSQNNLRHGFTGNFKVLEWERQEDFEALLSKFAAEHQPSNPYEFVLVEKMAQHFWLSERALILQEQCFRPDLAMQEADDERTGRLVPVVRDQDRKLALYLRYQTTHDRAFRQIADELRKARNEKRKHEIGFESQKQREAHEIRKQEMHEARLRLVNSKADHNEIDSDIRQTIEAPLPGHMRIPFDTMKKVFSSAVDQVNREMRAADAA